MRTGSSSRLDPPGCASTGAGPIVAVLLFAYFNLHHYAVDAVIWRSRDGHVRRIVHGPAPPT